MAGMAAKKFGGPVWSAAISSGLIAGLVFILLEMTLVATAGDGNFWGPPRMIGAIVLGDGVLPPPAGFLGGPVAVGLLLHFVLSVLLGAIFALGAARLGMGAALLAGAVFGVVVYLVDFYAWTAVFPWFANARNGITITSHVVFGLVLAWAYKLMEARVRPRVR